jgi:hypothetical protein
MLLTACETTRKDHAIAFARAMFAHTRFETEIANLQAAITRQADFGELRENRCGSKQRPLQMRKLIEKHRGQLPQTEEIISCLNAAIDPCEQRNLLAHGSWWGFP